MRRETNTKEVDTTSAPTATRSKASSFELPVGWGNIGTGLKNHVDLSPSVFSICNH